MPGARDQSQIEHGVLWPKLAGNVERDRRVDAALEADGWRVLRVWEHEDPAQAVDKVAALLAVGRG